MKKNKIILIALVFFIISAKEDLSDVIVFPSPESPAGDIIMDNAKIVSDSAGKKMFELKDLSYKGKSNPLITDLLLSFNSESYKLVRDDTGKYNIRKADYRDIKNNGSLGGFSAGFLKKGHVVEIEPSRNLWLGSCNDLGSFAIEFRFFPVSFGNDSVLFSRVGYFSGKKNGLEIKLKNRRMLVELFRIFKDTKQVRYDVRLLKGREIEPGRWHHFILSYDRISGKLSKYIDGIEEETIFVTATDKPFEETYMPSFECVDMPASFIGGKYNGYLDEFRISYREIDNLQKETEIAYKNYKKVGLIGRDPVNESGTLTSPVYNFAGTGTSVTLFKWNESLRENTFIWMEFRISDSLFNLDDTTLRWYRITNEQKNIYLMKEGSDFLRGKYYQWRANLIPSPDGRYSPSLYDIEISYRLDPEPKSPQFIEAPKAGAGDRHVTLRWNKNVEHDIMGYRIYYGLESGKYTGIIDSVNGKRITNELNSNRRYIELEITNDIINENKDKNMNGNRNYSFLEYPLLKNTVLYFFSVSAYDSYKPDTPHNHESALSKEVNARPFAGSEIKVQ